VALIFKIFPKYEVDVRRAIVINYFTCVATAWLTDFSNFNASLSHLADMIHWSLPMGVLFFSVFVVIGKTVANHGVMVATTSQKLSLIIPVLVALIFFGEALTPWKISGLIAAVLAVVFINSNGSFGLSNSLLKATLSLPFLTWLGSSMVDLSLFLSEREGISADHGLLFTASLFGFAGLTGLIYVITRDIKSGEKWSRIDIIAGILLGIPNFFSIYLIVVLLAQGWQGSVLFPMLNVSIILLTTLSGIFLFKEDFTPNRIKGFVLAVAAIVLLSLPWN
jgi:drug/metabolite transporter (DMT)-like permease